MLRRETCQVFLLFIELVLVTAAVCILAHGRAPGLPTTLWTAGGGEPGWNSNPWHRIYFYANHKQPPDVPNAWTENLGDSLLGISILNAAIWATKVAMFRSSIDPPWVGAVYDLLLSGLWMYGVNAQSSRDLTNTQHLNPQPCYPSCAEASGRDDVLPLCGQGKASFTVAVVALIFYFVRSIWSVLRLAAGLDNIGENEEKEIV
ncbi:hypothetical protein B0T16DRAFT_452419 [Cercophora newfieldiana]|uniref:MARVEL domain-containing protein n=1 Tax=Cercophora newfieldiana TaxID=92897 RepID=A0AA39YQR1_9PEZI|nr:hypothetical protein B0T16DRAFT_452419 [Cercophora newfieldiana]